jgi:hypothetical protein
MDKGSALSLWNEYVITRERSEKLRYQLFSEHLDALPQLVRESLSDPHHLMFSLEIGAELPLENRKELLADFLAVASYGGGHVVRAREIIRAFPSDWLLENIESAAAPLLEHGGAEEYRRLLELYVQVDRQLALRLVERASTHEDPELRDVVLDI